MSKVTTVRFGRHVSDAILCQIAALAVRVGRVSRMGLPDALEHLAIEQEAEQRAGDWLEELSLFTDWDLLWGRGRGVYAQDDEECRSRRIDLRGPHDGDPGPLPMEEAPDDITAKHLLLSLP